MLSVQDLARDERFSRIRVEDLVFDPRNATLRDDSSRGGFRTDDADAPDAARSLMHGIFVGEIQALEGAGRTCFDYDAGSGAEEVPFQLKLDMARQCWDEARHVEISVKLTEHMGSEIGEFGEQVMLFEAACHPDPIFRLCGVNRALEGLAIDVFNTMREYGNGTGDPVLAFCEDWMLADEVTHVKMGSDWLRRITANDPDRMERALEFQHTVDKVFSLGGFRGESEENPIQITRRFRELAGFSEEECDELAATARQAMEEAQMMVEMAASAGASSLS